MEIRQYFSLIKRWAWLIFLGVITAGGTAYYVSNAQTPIFQATTLLLITEGDLTGSNEFSALQASERLAQSYMERLKNHEVLKQVTQNLGISVDIKDLQDAISINQVNKSQLIALHVENPDPKLAVALADEIPVVFSNRNITQQQERFAESKTNLESEIETLQTELLAAESELADKQESGLPPEALDQLNNNIFRLRESRSQLLTSYEEIRLAEAQRLNNLIVDEHAQLPDRPIRPRTVTNTLLAAVVGGMLSLGIVFLIEYLDDTIKSPEQIEAAFGFPTIGIVTHYNTKDLGHKPIMMEQPRSPVAESYRQLRTNIFFARVDRPIKSISITSANATEGKSTTSLNLAIAMAQAGNRVILVDTDLRRPSLHTLLGTTNNDGVTLVLLDCNFDITRLHQTNVEGLKFLPSGPLPHNPAELLGTDRMKEMTRWLSSEADYVIYDTPPILAVTDASLISQFTDTSLIVINSQATPISSLSAAVNQLETIGGNIVGGILNQIDWRKTKYAYYYKSYYNNGYGYDADSVKGLMNKKNPFKGTSIKRVVSGLFGVNHIG